MCNKIKKTIFLKVGNKIAEAILLVPVFLSFCLSCEQPKPAEPVQADNVHQRKTLVIITGSIRGSDIAHASLERHLLKPNQADLFLYTEKSGKPSSYLHQLATHLVEYTPVDDWREVADQISKELFGEVRWRGYPAGTLGMHLIGEYDEANKWTGVGTGLLTLSLRYRALKWLEQNGVLENYQDFVVSRSDYYYVADHPDITALLGDNNHVAIPFVQEDYEGICDRFAAVDRIGLQAYLGALKVLLEFHPEYGPYPNIEKVLDVALRKIHHIEPVRYMSPSYMVRSESDGSGTWSLGSRRDSNGLWIKQEAEYQEAEAYLKSLTREKI